MCVYKGQYKSARTYKGHIPRMARVSKTKFKLCFADLLPNPGPGRIPLDSDRGDVEFASVFVSVASSAVSFVPEPICWNLAENFLK